MKLYHAATSPNSRRVRIFIAEKNLKVDLVSVDLAAKEQFSQAYRAINPRVVVPTLVLDDGTAIGEVPAIMRYLDEAYPEAPLLGRTPTEKAIVVMWERRVDDPDFLDIRLGIGVQQLSNANSLDVDRRARAALAELAKHFPPGLEYAIAFDSTTAVSDSIREVLRTLVEAIVIVIGVIFLFLLDWRATIIPAVTIPVSLIGTFVFFDII